MKTITYTHSNIPFVSMTEQGYWLEKRDQYMQAARRNMAVLLDKESSWKYERNDPRVIAANRSWVDRARHCHTVAMGRKEIANFVVIEEFSSVREVSLRVAEVA